MSTHIATYQVCGNDMLLKSLPAVPGALLPVVGSAAAVCYERFVKVHTATAAVEALELTEQRSFTGLRHHTSRLCAEQVCTKSA